MKVDGEDQDAYVVVDTAYYDGTETSKFLQLNYDAFKADNRAEGSYYFKFTYNAAEDELYIQVQKVVYKLTKIQVRLTRTLLSISKRITTILTGAFKMKKALVR